MKKIIGLILFTTILTSAAMAQGTEDTEPGAFATKGIMEIGGSVSASVAVQEDSQKYSFDLAPSFNYFVIDRVHLGIRPIYRYNLNYANATDSYDSDYEILPAVIAGYTFPIAERLFVDIAPQFGFLYGNIFSSNTDHSYMCLYYALTCALKYNFGGSLLHINLEQYYSDRISKEGPDNVYKLALGVGWSLYF